MQGAPDITGAGYEYDLTWLYTLGTCYFIIVQWEDTTQVYNSRVTGVDAWGELLCFAILNAKTGPI